MVRLDDRCRDSPCGQSRFLAERRVLVEVVSQGARTDADRTRGLPLDRRHLQCPTNRLAFDPLDVLPKVQRWNPYGVRLRSSERDGVIRNPCTAAQYHRPLDGILQLANVA